MTFDIKGTRVQVDTSLFQTLSFMWVAFTFFASVLQVPLIASILIGFSLMALIFFLTVLHEISHAWVGIKFGEKIQHIYFGGKEAHVLFVRPGPVTSVRQNILISFAGIFVDSTSALLFSVLASIAFASGNTLVAMLIGIIAIFELVATIVGSTVGDGKHIRNLRNWLKDMRKTLEQSAREVAEMHSDYVKLKELSPNKPSERIKSAHINGILEAQRIIRFAMPSLSTSERIELEQRLRLYDKWQEH